MKWDGKLTNQSGMLNAFTWLNQDSAVDREVHSKSDFIRVRFCKTLSERHLRALDEIFFSLVWKKTWYYGITSSFSLSLSSKYLCDCAAPLGTEYCWNIQSLERCDTQFVLKLSTWFHPNLILEKSSKHWKMIYDKTRCQIWCTIE